MASDSDQCPARGPSLAHVSGRDGRCPYCGAPCSQRGSSPDRDPARPRRARSVPAYLESEWRRAKRAGLSDRDAAQLIAFQHGLEPAGERPWSLWTLAQLEFTRWRVGPEDRLK